MKQHNRKSELKKIKQTFVGYTCRYCPLVFSDLISLKQHLQVTHKDVPTEQKLLFLKDAENFKAAWGKRQDQLEKQERIRKHELVRERTKANKEKAAAARKSGNVPKRKRKSVRVIYSAIESNRRKH